MGIRNITASIVVVTALVLSVLPATPASAQSSTGRLNKEVTRAELTVHYVYPYLLENGVGWLLDDAASSTCFEDISGYEVRDRRKICAVANAVSEQLENELGLVAIIQGYPDGSFKPTQTVSRAQTPTILKRAQRLAFFASSPMSQRDLVDAKIPRPWPFKDVSTSNVHAPAIGGLYDAGVINGCTWTRYCPDKGVTHRQIQTLLERLDDAFGIRKVLPA